MIPQVEQRCVAVLQRRRIGGFARKPVFRGDHHRTVFLHQRQCPGHEDHLRHAGHIPAAMDPQDPRRPFPGQGAAPRPQDQQLHPSARGRDAPFLNSVSFFHHRLPLPISGICLFSTQSAIRVRASAAAPLASPCKTSCPIIPWVIGTSKQGPFPVSQTTAGGFSLCPANSTHSVLVAHSCSHRVVLPILSL